MSENSVPPPFIHYNVPFPPPPSFLAEGLKSGVMTATILALLYALVIPLFYISIFPPSSLITIPTELRDFKGVVEGISNLYLWYILIATVAALFGGFPAVLWGAIGGAIIGIIFREWIKERLEGQKGFNYGFTISICLTSPVLFLGEMLTYLDYTDLHREPFGWVGWFIPNILAFFGFWWIVYKVNARMPMV